MDLPRAVSGKTRAVAIQREIRPCFDEVIRSQPCAAIVRLTLVAFMTTNHGPGSRINRPGAAVSDVPPGSGVTGEFAALNIATVCDASQQPTVPRRKIGRASCR